MKYTFKIRFNTNYRQSESRYWKVLINEEEHLVSEVIIRQKDVRTIRHTLPSGEQKWSIYCESDFYRMDDKEVLIIE